MTKSELIELDKYLIKEIKQAIENKNSAMVAVITEFYKLTLSLYQWGNNK